MTLFYYKSMYEGQPLYHECTAEVSDSSLESITKEEYDAAMVAIKLEEHIRDLSLEQADLIQMRNQEDVKPYMIAYIDGRLAEIEEELLSINPNGEETF